MLFLLCLVAVLIAKCTALMTSSPYIGTMVRDRSLQRSLQPTAAGGVQLKLNLLKGTVSVDTDNPIRLSEEASLGVLSSAIELVESATELEPLCALEISLGNSIVFGNYFERKMDSSAIRVKFASGVESWIDSSQVVSVWDTLSDEEPVGEAQWEATLLQAEKLLNQSVPRKTNLDEFWYLVRQQRSSALPVDSQDVGVYLFQESKFNRWKDPSLDAEVAKVWPLSAAQRAAAAMLLHLDGAVHFKRRPSAIAKTHSDPADSDGGFVRITEGGYKIVDESIVCFKECEMFVEYFASRTREEQTEETMQDSPVIRRLLRQIELFALSSSTTAAQKGRAGVPPSAIAPAPKVIKMILKKLGLPVTTLSAQSVLVKLGQRSSSRYNPVYSNLSRVSAPAKGTSKAAGKAAAHAVSGTVALGVEAQEHGSAGYMLNLTPWPSEVLAEAAALKADVETQRQKLDDAAPVGAGKRGPQGSMDYRQSTSAHPAVCIDTKYASFRDDAFSLSPETGELLIHVVDVAGKLRQYPELQQAMKERVSTSFLPSGPLHMLPPAALESLSLSDSAVNEAITVALSVNYDTGEVLSYRVFPSILGPVTALDIHTANEIIAGVGVQSVSSAAALESAGHGDVVDSAAHREHGQGQPIRDRKSSGGLTSELRTGKVKGHTFGSQDPLSTDQSTRPGYSNALVRDLRMAYALIAKMCAREPWLDASLRRNGKQNSEWQIDHQQGVVYRQELSSVHSHRLVNALLSLYATSAHQYCKDNKVAVPLAWENRDRVDSSKPRRFATQPLRNWISQLQQKQVRAALKMELPLSQKDCALAVSHHNERRRQQAGLVGRVNSV